MKFIVRVCCILGFLVMLGCEKDSKNSSFEIPLQRDFYVNAGLSPIIGHFYEFTNVPTNVSFLLDQSNVIKGDVVEIAPLTCRIETVFGSSNLDFLFEVTVSIAPASDPDLRYEVFYRDPVPDNTGTTLDLIPTLANVMDVMCEDNIIVTLSFVQLRNTNASDFEGRLLMEFGVIE